MEVAEIITKFETILASVPQAQKDALAHELAKITPATAEAEVEWRIYHSFNVEENSSKAWFSVKVIPAQQSQSQDIKKLLICFLQIKDKLILKEILDCLAIFLESNAPYQLLVSPALYIAENTGAMMFSFKGKVNENSHQFIEFINRQPVEM